MGARAADNGIVQIVQEALQARWSELTDRWPTLNLDVADVASALQSRGVDDLEGVHWAELVLAWACGKGHPIALKIFEAEFISRTDAVLRRLDSDPAFVDEAQQRLRARLLVSDGETAPRVAAYAGRGPLIGWVRVAAARVGLGFLRETKRGEKRDELLWADAVLFPGGAPTDLEYLKQRYASVLTKGLKQACAELEDRERAVLRMYFVEGLNIDKIGVVYGVHRATVARWISKTKASLTERMHAVMVAQAAIPPEELESIDRLVRSQLEISLGGLLGEPDAP